MAIKRCTESFSVWREGVPTAFTVGQLVDEKHPIIRSHGHLFADPEATVRPAAVEAATAAPGELRDLAPPATTGEGEASEEETAGDASSDEKPSAPRRGRRTK
ncbi:hypothetical protein ACWGH2_16225 [Streptomyces sp. NPDC054871]